jgi:hypothetical protein
MTRHEVLDAMYRDPDVAEAIGNNITQCKHGTTNGNARIHSMGNIIKR